MERDEEFLRRIEPYDLEWVTPTIGLKNALNTESLYNDTMVRYNKIRHKIKEKVEQKILSDNNSYKYARIFIINNKS